jgi:membrane-associated protein
MLMQILLEFHWTNLLQPQFYIEHGGLWLILFVVFAETGLFAGFFLPGDSLVICCWYLQYQFSQ